MIDDLHEKYRDRVEMGNVSEIGPFNLLQVFFLKFITKMA